MDARFLRPRGTAPWIAWSVRPAPAMPSTSSPRAPRPSAAPTTPRALPDGLRATRATRAVLALMDSDPAVARSGTDVVAALERRGVSVNRVTVYRLLDRLAVAGLLERHVDGQRVTRYAIAARAPDRAAPRFVCADCHRQFRLPEGAAPVQSALQDVLRALASAGHEELAVDIAVRGRCAGCAHPEKGA